MTNKKQNQKSKTRKSLNILQKNITIEQER